MPKLFCFLLFLCATGVAAQQRFQFSQPKMGSPFNLIFYAADSADAADAAQAAFALVDSLNVRFSDYLDSSELNRLSRTAGSGKFGPVSPLLYEIIANSKKAAAASRHTFDITIGPLSRLWRQARREKQFPQKNAVMEAKARTGMHHVLLDPKTKSVKLVPAGMQLDLGGIAKGYVAQKVIQFLRDRGIGAALADAGGDLVCSAPPPGKEGWTVGINAPGSGNQLLPQTVVIKSSAVATSGDLYQYLEHNGKRYSHIIDPRTGYGVPFQRNVTILAPDGATADWLATACSILPLPQCKKLVRQHGADLLVTQLKNGRLQYHMTKGMKKKLRL